MRTALFPASFLLLASLQAAAPEGGEAMHALLSRHFRPEAPGALVLVTKNGQVLLHRAYGMANLELEVPLTTESVFEVASVSKQFTAAAVLKLAEEGKVDLQAPLSRYFPEAPERWAKVKVEHLLNHTSGIPRITEAPPVRNRIREDYRSEELLAVTWTLPLAFEPGTQFSYGGAGYTLLALLVERVSGKPFPEFLQQRFFGPLGMKHTTFSREGVLIRGRASSYLPDGNPAPFENPTLLLGQGDYASTAQDLAMWMQALHGGKVLGKAALQRMCQAVPLADGRSTRYGCGLDVLELQGQPFIGHTGDAKGFHSAAFYLPQSAIAVVVLYNGTPEQEPAYFARRLAALAMGAPLQEPRVVSVSRLQALVGRYSDGQRQEEIRLEKGALVRVGRTGAMDPIQPLSPTEWCFGPEDDRRLLFTLEAGRATQLRWSAGQHGPDPVLRRVD